MTAFDLNIYWIHLRPLCLLTTLYREALGSELPKSREEEGSFVRLLWKKNVYKFHLLDELLISELGLACCTPEFLSMGLNTTTTVRISTRRKTNREENNSRVKEHLPQQGHFVLWDFETKIDENSQGLSFFLSRVTVCHGVSCFSSMRSSSQKGFQ